MSRTPYLDLNIPDKSSKGFVVTDVFEPNFTKLDQEAERINLRKMSTEDNIEELRKANRYKLGDVVEVLGFHAKGDGSHHKRVARSEDDGSGELGQNGIWWCIVHNREVNVSWFGAKGDGVTDDTVYFNKTATYCRDNYIQFVSHGKNKIDGEVNLRSVNVNITGEILNNVPFVLGGNSIAYSKNYPCYINKINDVNVIGAKTLVMTINRARHILLKAYGQVAEDSNIAYCTFNFNYSSSISLEGDNVGEVAWINENTFNLKRTKLFRIGMDDLSDNYSHNMNIINTGSIEENDAYIKLNKCRNNIFKNIRLEGKANITASKEAFFNIVESSYLSSDNYIDHNNTQFNFEDKNGTNILTKTFEKSIHTIKSYFINAYNLDNFNIYKAISITASGGKITIPQGAYFYTDLFEIGEFLYISADSDNLNQGLRKMFKLFDENLNEIVNDDYEMYFSGEGYYKHSVRSASNKTNTFVSTCRTSISTSNAKYIQFYITASPGISTSCININVKSSNPRNKFVPPKINSYLNINSLDTPYYTLKMQEQGIYADYVDYRDELHEYESSQTTDETMLLPVLQEPAIPESVELFAKKYNLI